MTREFCTCKRTPYCHIDSQFNNGASRGSSLEYNSNNSWYFNGGNRCINNNNRYNSNFRSRPVLDIKGTKDQHINTYTISLEQLIQIEKESYNGKQYSIRFRADYCHNMVQIWHEINNYDVHIDKVHRFVVDIPKTREIIFCDYKDKIIQSLYVSILKQKLENGWFNDLSFSCRKNKGVIKAVQQASYFIKKASNNYKEKNIYLASIDLKNFFMSIDVKLAYTLMCRYINWAYKDDPLKDLLLYLTSVLYLTDYSKCVEDHSNPAMEAKLNPEKSILNSLPERGVPIGNWPSQIIGNFLTSFALNYIQKLGYKYFVHYTDDTIFILNDKKKFLNDVNEIAKFYDNKLHLTLHPKKRYIQHYSKGIKFLGRKLKFNRILPSNRTYNSVKLLVDKIPSYDISIKNLDMFMQSYNSYMGLLRTMTAYNLRKRFCYNVKNSKFGKYYKIDIKCYHKIVLKKQYHLKNIYISNINSL